MFLAFACQKHQIETSAREVRLTERKAEWAVIAAIVGLLFAGGHARAAQSRSYAIDWFSLGSYSQDGDCSRGVNPPSRLQYLKALELLGKSQAEIDQFEKTFASERSADSGNAREMIRNRGRINGEAVNAFVHPWAVADPNLNSVDGKYSFGFDLDGEVNPTSFEEPMTKEKGIDNQLFRALGCIEQFRGTYASSPTYWAYTWGSIRGRAPAWLMTISGDDLEKDGPITITFDRAAEQIISAPAGGALADVTYRIDPDPRNHHVFKGQIREGVISIIEPGYLRLQLDTMAFSDLRLSKTHLRLTIDPSGHLNGFLGGYQPVRDVYFGLSLGGLGIEGTVLNDIPGIYHLLRKHADAEPDPNTGVNTAISTAYRIEAVPVFAVPVDQAH